MERWKPYVFSKLICPPLSHCLVSFVCFGTISRHITVVWIVMGKNSKTDIIPILNWFNIQNHAKTYYVVVSPHFLLRIGLGAGCHWIYGGKTKNWKTSQRKRGQRTQRKGWKTRERRERKTQNLGFGDTEEHVRIWSEWWGDYPGKWRYTKTILRRRFPHSQGYRLRFFDACRFPLCRFKRYEPRIQYWAWIQHQLDFWITFRGDVTQ